MERGPKVEAEGRSLLVSAGMPAGIGELEALREFKDSNYKNNGGARHCSSALQSHSLDTFRRVTISGFNLGISPGR